MLTAFVLAHKYNEDTVYSDKCYAKVFKIDTKELGRLENNYTETLDFCMFVKENHYNKYSNFLTRLIEKQRN